VHTSKPEEHIYFLDYLRGIAIILVFVFHALGASYGTDQLNWNGWLRDFHHASPTFLLLLPATFGWSGVAIFFVVSGFCIHLSHERSKAKQFKIFFARRFFRIYPPYFVALIFFALLFPLTRSRLDSINSFAQLGSHLLLLHNFDSRSFFGINPAFWSIAIEAQLYLLYPLLLLFVRSFGWKNALWLTGTIEILMRAISGWHDTMPQWFTGSPFAFWFSWSIGAALADDFLKGQPLILSRCPLWVWPSFIIISYFIKPLSAFGFLSVALFTANVIACLARPVCPLPQATQTHSVLARLARHISRVGIVSYSVYLIHQPLIWIAPRLFKKIFPAQHIHPLIVFASCLLEWPFVLFLSYYFYHFVEQPSISIGKWFVRTKLVVDH
jgi:peptidoglycan/LPS O-acetylase OafA/YrhL